jgi:hypothetical protein
MKALAKYNDVKEDELQFCVHKVEGYTWSPCTA